MAADPEELDLQVGNVRLHARRWGPIEAPLTIGIPGLTGNSSQFSTLGSHLGGSQRLLALDLRGRAGSDVTPPGTYGWERHARDVLAVADELGVERFAVVGVSMGGSVAMKVAELQGDRLQAVVLVDIAGRVDPGIGPVVASAIGQVGPDADRDAVLEDRAYTATQDPYDRWRHLTMPTLLLRATREMRPGCGYVVPVDDRDAFVRAVGGAEVVEVDADHITISDHPDSARAIERFLRRSAG